MLFYYHLEKGLREYGCKINQKKTCSNILSISSTNSESKDCFWFGLKFPLKLSCKSGITFTLDKAKHVQTLTTVKLKQQNNSCIRFLFRYTKRKCLSLIICWNKLANSSKYCINNLYKIAISISIQWLIRTKIFRLWRAKINRQTLFDIVRIIRSLAVRVFRILAKNQQLYPGKFALIWIFLKAFYKTCKRHSFSVRLENILKNEMSKMEHVLRLRTHILFLCLLKNATRRYL